MHRRCIFINLKRCILGEYSFSRLEGNVRTTSCPCSHVEKLSDRPKRFIIFIITCSAEYQSGLHQNFQPSEKIWIHKSNGTTSGVSIIPFFCLTSLYKLTTISIITQYSNILFIFICF